MTIERRTDEAFAWVEQVTGGKITDKQTQERWRPQWFLDVDMRGKPERYVMRGFRNPGYTRGAADEAGTRTMLAIEAEVLRALQATPLAVPRYFGHNSELGWMLMEWVEGQSELTGIAEPERRFQIYQGYVEELAKLHAHPIDTLDLPPQLPRPASAKEFLRTMFERNRAFYRGLERRYPEPVIELGLNWLADNELPSERPIGLGLTDVGPDQFLFKGSAFRCLIDLEYATPCDPLYEMGKMRSRDVTYRTGRMPEHLLHYGRCYQALTGIPLDIKALQYWTIAGPVLSSVFTAQGAQRADPQMPDLAFLYAWEVQQKRCILEGLAEYHGFRLTPPSLPVSRTTLLEPLHEAMVGQFEAHYGPRATDPDDVAFARYSAAIARTLALGAHSAQIDRDNLEELSDLIGQRVEDWMVGLALLEAAIARDYAKDFEKRVGFLYRAEVRREFLYEPMQRATGVTHAQPLDRFDDLPARPAGLA